MALEFGVGSTKYNPRNCLGKFRMVSGISSITDVRVIPPCLGRQSLVCVTQESPRGGEVDCWRNWILPWLHSFICMAVLLLRSVFLSPTNFPVYHIFPPLNLLLVVSQFSPHFFFYWVVRCKILLLRHSSLFHLPLHFRSFSFFLFLFLSFGDQFRFLNIRGLILGTDRRQLL